ncbi:hypothetical protein PYW07_006694 [Mythimna separata]|uniref:DUF4817 domain-containing protein n=1 Tax=Mythimna separata TaxID=271217 RepID=A0AAD7YVC0_MYTSE|nr:hypothetical protein PYW07_006694 [Mythimna separata]
MPRYQFSAQEYANMVLIYAECNYDGARALRMYGERYPNAHQPRNSRVIVSALVRIRNNEPVVPRRSGGPRPVISVRQEENVLRHFEEEPGSSTRRAGRLLNMSHVAVFKILNKNKQHAYSLQKVQGLLGPADFERRLTYCQWALQRCAEDTHFIENVIWNRIREDPLLMRRVHQNTRRRLQQCVDRGGQHIEQFKI